MADSCKPSGPAEHSRSGELAAEDGTQPLFADGFFRHQRHNRDAVGQRLDEGDLVGLVGGELEGEATQVVRRVTSC